MQQVKTSRSLQDRIKASFGEPSQAKKSKHSSIEEELDVFESIGEVGPRLQQLIQNLKLVRPTSVDSERTFSICGLIETAKRTRLSEAKLCMLIFLNQNL